MDLVQQFETPVTGRDSNTYLAYLYARLGDHKTWEGWLLFERVSDGRRFETGVETTQSTRDGIIYWASGLTATFFEGSLERALHQNSRKTTQRIAMPVVDNAVDAQTRADRLSEIEREIMAMFAQHRSPRVLAQEMFDRLPFANADVVRALEALEKQSRLVVRQTEEGNDWVYLTEEGLRAAGLADLPHRSDVGMMERPKTR